MKVLTMGDNKENSLRLG